MALGLILISLGSVLMYVALRNISVGDFFRSLYTSGPATPRHLKAHGK